MFKNILAVVAVAAGVMIVFNLFPRGETGPTPSELAAVKTAEDIAALQAKYGSSVDLPDPAALREHQEIVSKMKAERSAEALEAHDHCARAIAKHLGVDNWGAIPVAKNNGSGNEFYFAWPTGRIGLQTALGDVPISASCVGTLNPLQLQWVTVNGKDVI